MKDFIMLAVMGTIYFLLRWRLLKKVLEESSAVSIPLAVLPMIFWVTMLLAHYIRAFNILVPVPFVLLIIISAVCIFIPIFKEKCREKYYAVTLLTAIGEFVCAIAPSLLESTWHGVMNTSDVSFTVTVWVFPFPFVHTFIEL
ncbi:MAG: hypothetical protein IJ446_10710 [Oscillospiraceae bacterium]|nr:hypothetical protein [Oscillospiraceae bacterium]